MPSARHRELARRWGVIAKPFPVRSHDAVGSKRLDSINDYARQGYDLRVTCRGCGRVVVLDSARLATSCGNDRHSRDISAIQARLSCRECGGRDVKCGAVERDRQRNWGYKPGV